MGLIDKAKVKQRFTAALGSYDEQAGVQKQINRRLCDFLLATGQRHFAHILEIGCGTGDLTRLLVKNVQANQWTFNDLCDTRPHIAALLGSQPFRYYCGDGENLSFSEQYDLIATASTVQWFDNKHNFIRRSAERLVPGGLLLFSTFSAQNLYQIRQLTGIGLDYPGLSQWQQWLTQDFELLQCTEQKIDLYFSSPLAVLQHLKQSGVTATRQQVWSKGKLKSFCENYTKNYRTSANQVTLTYTPMLFLARKKGLNQ